MVKVNKISRWLGGKVGVTITDKDGRILSAEKTYGGSAEAWVNENDPEQIEKELRGNLQADLVKDEARARTELRDLFAAHVGAVLISSEVLKETLAVMPNADDEGVEAPFDDGPIPPPETSADIKRVLEEGAPDIRIWFKCKDVDKLVSELPLESLLFHHDEGRIYKKGKKAKPEDDPDLAMFARAVDYWLERRRGEREAFK